MADLRYTATVDTTQGVRSLQNLQSQAGRTTNSFSGLQKALVGLGAGAALGAFTLAMRGALKSVDDLAKSARALGIAADSFQALSRSAQLAGVSTEQLSSTIQRLQVNLGQGLARGTGPAVDAMNALGLSLREVSELPADQQIERITQALQGVENPAQRAALATELLGRQGPRMLEVADNMRRIKAETEQLGLALTGVDTRAIEAANDAISELVFIIQSTLQAAVAELAPYITAIANLFKNSIMEGGNLGSVIRDNIIPALKLATQALAAFVGFLVAAKIVSVFVSITQAIIATVTALRGATTAMAAFNAVANKNPILRILSALLSLAGAVGAVWAVNAAFDAIDDEVAEILEKLKEQEAEFQRSQASAGGLLDTVGKQRDAVAATVDQYRSMGDEFRKNFDFQTRLLGLTDEQKLSAQTLNDLQKDYTKTIETLTEKLEQANSASEQDRIRGAIAEVTAEYERQLPLVERLIQARQQELRVIEAQRNIQQAVESSTQFIDKLSDGIQSARNDIEALNMNRLDRQVFEIRNRIQKDLQVQVRRLQALMTSTNAGQIQTEIQRITEAANQALSIQEDLARRSYAHQRTFAFGWKSAFEQYADAATNAAEVAGRVFQKTMQGMEDMIVNFAKTGKFEWKNFVAMMLEELLRAQIQSIFAQLLGGMTGAIGGASGSIAGGGSGGGILGPIGDAFGIGGSSGALGASASNPVYVFCVNGAMGGAATIANGGIAVGPTSPLSIGSSFGIGSAGTSAFQKQLGESLVNNMVLNRDLGGPTVVNNFANAVRSFDDLINIFANETRDLRGFVPGTAPSVAPGTGIGGTTIPTVAQIGDQVAAGPRTTGSGIGGTAFPFVSDIASEVATGVSPNLFTPSASGSGRSSSDWFVDRGSGGAVAFPITPAGERAGAAGYSPLNFGGAFALGGMLGAGKWGIAGEAGPELISGPAQITPLDKMGGSTNVTYNINAVDARSFKEMLAQDPGYIYGLTLQGSKGVPSRR